MKHHVFDPRLHRGAGVLLHVTSLPGPYGIGELGPEAVNFIESLAAAGQRVWQVLPLGPVSDDGCPYRTESVFAGGPLLISTHRLIQDGLLDEADTTALRACRQDRVDFPRVRRAKTEMLRKAFARWADRSAVPQFEAENQAWLPEYALFHALRIQFGGAAWTSWPNKYAQRDPATLETAREKLASEIDFAMFLQLRFAEDLAKVRTAAAANGIALVADLPFYPSADSADVWAHPELFWLRPDGSPASVAGAPPDYFSADGQIWGNVLYQWATHEQSDFRWWSDRVAHAARTSDIIRFDHFRGFQSFWAIPADAGSARDGGWQPGPGNSLFEAVRTTVGDVPMIADDLGSVTTEVEQLRAAVGIPGMKVLQFTRSADGPNHLPFTYSRDSVVYTGTHDNETTDGWWARLGEGDRTFLREHFGDLDDDVCWGLARAATASVANLVVLPVQDLKELNNEARMNEPGVETGCWTWRSPGEPLSTSIEFRLHSLARTYGRLPDQVSR